MVVSMTKDEALRLALEALEDHGHAWPQIHHQSRYAQAMTSVREALAQPEQEPVVNTDHVICPNCVHQFRAIPQNVQKLMLDAGFEPPFTTPPQRTWVGLTDEQYLEACQMAEAGNYMVAFQRIQQWLKEKNT